MTALLLSLAAFASEPRLVQAYDVGALAAIEAHTDLAPWRAADGMVATCGPATAPLGMDHMEMEDIAHGRRSALTLLVDTGGVPQTTAHLHVSIGTDAHQQPLAPAVNPRRLSLTIASDAPSATTAVHDHLRQQLCLEHHVGRASRGLAALDLHDALRWDPVHGGAHRDDTAFVGQGVTVSALLGAPDACIRPSPGLPTAEEPPLDARPTSGLRTGHLRPCAPTERPGLPWDGPEAPGFSVEDLEHTSASPPATAWQDLTIRLSDGPAPQDLRVSVVLDGTGLTAQEPLFTTIEGSSQLAMRDLLATLPHTFPQVGHTADPDRYSLLMVPGWQVARALDHLSAEGHHPPGWLPGTDLSAVAWLLDHPSWLHVLRQDGAEAGVAWDIARVMSDPLGIWAWGHPVRARNAWAPVVRPGAVATSREGGLLVRRSGLHAEMLVSGAVLLVFVAGGLLRIRRLISRPPALPGGRWPGMHP